MEPRVNIEGILQAHSIYSVLKRNIGSVLRGVKEFVIWATKDFEGLLGLTIITSIGALAVLVNWLNLPDPSAMVYKPFTPPSLNHLLGTDRFGRDVLSRILWGARTSLIVGLSAAISASLIGSLLGVIAGVYRGLIDMVISRVVEIFMMIPAFFLALILAVTLGPSIYNIIFVVSVTSWPTIARVVRGQVLSLVENQYVEVAKSFGASNRYIMFKHVLPQAIPLIISYTILLVGNAMLLEAGLSYLGLGDPNIPSWGRMIYEGQQLLFTAWWLSVFPGLFLTLTVLGWNFLGDSLINYLNPKKRIVREFEI
ncbi:ABC transporter permease [Thermogladius sp. 4427co]|uniref:ABC transporter permease n=1 Tax=Thermogladius sp. 4427co TaxID=3450718 RepID=UPI003F7B0A2B